MKKEDAKSILKSIKSRVNQVQANSKTWDAEALLAMSLGALAMIILEENISD